MEESKMTSFIVFQFQNGTIKSDIIGGLNYVVERFQFQNGTIKSARLTKDKYFNAYFNSKMVRLKGD